MPAPNRDVYTPARLNREARSTLEGRFPLIWVEGELSNLARPASGHLYFSLKDARAQVRCALFRNWAQYLRFNPADGLSVLVRARVSLYEARGEFQLIVEHMEPAGEGALQREFERLKAELDKAGLFALEHKRPLPAFPHRIGVVTSASGAALHDVLTVLRRRLPAVGVRLYPVPVQGPEAAPAIAAALALAGARRDCDVLILTRGGGSLEDLWAFNERITAQAIFDCPLPVISAVGHEVDITIADLIADQRAPTPSAAAEMAVPDGAALAREFARYRNRLAQLAQRHLRESAQSKDRADQHMQRLRPDLRLQQIAGRLAYLGRRLTAGQMGRLGNLEAARHAAARRLFSLRPSHRLKRAADQRQALHQRARRTLARELEHRSAHLAALQRALVAVSPDATLGRGYAIVRGADGAVVRHAAQAPEGSSIHATLARGELAATVTRSKNE